MQKLLLILFVLLNVQLLAQDIEPEFDIEYDTLLIIGTDTIKDFKTYISKDSLLLSNGIQTNIEGLSVASFTLTAFSLGNQLHLTSNSNKFTISMRNAIINTQIKYKFVNIKDIVLTNPKDRCFSPSLQKVKLIFND